jgi:cation:H+ antiporter
MTTVLYIQLVGGLIYLLAGGDLLVRGAVALARRARVSPMIVALTVVAFGTSLPELVVVVRAALADHPGLVLGNVVGSNIANVLLVGGVAAAVYPLAGAGGVARRDSVIMIVASIGFILLCTSGEMGPIGGTVLLSGLAIVIMLAARDAARAHRAADDKTPLEWVLGLPDKPGTIALFILVGAVGLPLGASFVVESAVEIAHELGVSDAVVGLTIVAFSTSLPELATTVMAAYRKRTEVAVGAIIGSNIFNILAIMGVGAVLSPTPIPVPDGFFTLDFPVMLGAAIALAVFVARGRSIGRVAGIVFVTAYLGYIAAIVVRQGGLVY